MQSEKEQVALRAVELAKALILAENHFLSAAVGRLVVAPLSSACAFSTDGYVLGVDADRVCQAFKETKHVPKEDLLHAVIHCLFLHPYAGETAQADLWNLACDLVAERNVADLCGPRAGSRGAGISRALATVERDLGKRPSAERIYHKLMEGAWATELPAWRHLLLSDDHALWYAKGRGQASEQGKEGGQGPQGESGGQGENQSKTQSQTSAEATQRLQGKGAGSNQKDVAAEGPAHMLRTVARPSVQQQQEAWRRVSKALAVNLQTYAKGRGKKLSGLVSEVEENLHERVDYADFLYQFATTGEVLKLSQDEFDYIFYTYGLSLYGNVPLIEPLEYRDEKRVREFVIVIDTSGSVYESIVRAFVNTTFDVLKSTEAFFDQVNIRILQCDDGVQSDDLITSLDELKHWGTTLRVRGGGGTDFRPAFAYVDSLIEQGEFENLGGLVYFTDGWGEYPEWTPEYKAAFAFYDENYRPEEVPPWAVQVVLDKNGMGY